MIERAVALAKTRRVHNGSHQVIASAGDGFLKAEAKGEIGGNGSA
jgi:hypothetical protein